MRENDKTVIKVAPRPAVIRIRYAEFLSGLEKYLSHEKDRLDVMIRKASQE